MQVVTVVWHYKAYDVVSCDVLCLESELEEYDTGGVLCNLSRIRCWEDLVAKYQLAARDRPEQKWECPEDRKKAKDVLSSSAIIKANEFDFTWMIGMARQVTKLRSWPWEWPQTIDMGYTGKDYSKAALTDQVDLPQNHH